jgi:phosphatidylinositol dimannoside acyltransferase
MNLQGIINSQASIGLALALGKMIPEKSSYGLTNPAGKWIASLRKSAMVRAVRANQWVVSDGKLSGKELDRAVSAVFQSTAHCLYDFYHFFDRPEEIRQRVEITPDVCQAFERSHKGEGGMVCVTPHLSNFDLAGQALALHGWRILVLAYPQPNKGYARQNKIRSRGEFEVVPLSITTLRQAKERLKQRGVVLTGLERPITGTNYYPKFFGRPAPVPVTYIRLAMETHVPVVVVACQTRPDGSYLVQGSQPVWMQSDSDLKTSIEANAERVLLEVEKFIRPVPNQWSMFYPVWPEVVDNVTL